MIHSVEVVLHHLERPNANTNDYFVFFPIHQAATKLGVESRELLRCIIQGIQSKKPNVET